ncbi:MAG: hypothetical protein JXA23_02750 [Bacteroidales bacterium]|nr:hypothetical protein [Bacteroidales bacterium]
MKKILLFAGILLIAGACATKKINFDQLQERNGLLYMVNDDEPFTGEIQSYANGRVEMEGNVRNGLKEGLWIYYYPNGQKQMEGIYKDGLKEGTWTYWTDNGVQENIELYKLGTRLSGGEAVTDDEMSEGLQGEVDQELQSGSKGEISGNLSGGEKQSEPAPVVKEEKPKPQPVNYDWLTKGPVKMYQGRPYTGAFIKYYKEGSKGKYIYGYFTNGRPSGKWTYYHRDGRVKEYKYY